MTTVLGRRSAAAEPTGHVPANASRIPSPPVIRRPLLAASSIAVVIASIAIFVSIYSGVDHQVEVLEIIRPVAQGQSITAADLGSTGIVSSATLPTLSAGSATEVIGRVAAVPLGPGTVLVATELTSEQPVAAGDAVVGIALKDGQLPASGLQPGDAVMVVQTDAPGAAVTGELGEGGGSGPSSAASGGNASAADSNLSSTGVLVPRAQVREVESPSAASSGSETELVSIEVSQTLASSVSIAAAADQISLALLPQGGAHP